MWITDDETPGDVAPLSWAGEWPIRPGQGRRNIIVRPAVLVLAAASAAPVSGRADPDVSLTSRGSRWLVARVLFY